MSSLASSKASSPFTTVVGQSGTPLRLWNNSAERDQHENYASLFAIVKATEALEKAYTKDIISKAEYVFQKQFTSYLLDAPFHRLYVANQAV